MKSTILLLAFFAIAFSSCTTAYKTGQTPDDVYFSPASPQDDYVNTKKKDDRMYREDDYYNDRYLRMKVQNYNRWSELDDWYNYERYDYYYSKNYYRNYSWNPYTYWNYNFNPYCPNTIIINPKSTTYNKPRTFNLNTYNNYLLSNSISSNPKTSVNPKNTNPDIFNNPKNNNNSGLGNTLRNLFNGNNNNNSGSPGSGASGNNSSGSSGGSAPVRKFQSP